MSAVQATVSSQWDWKKACGLRSSKAKTFTGTVLSCRLLENLQTLSLTMAHSDSLKRDSKMSDVSTLPNLLTIRGKRLLLKPPTPEDDFPMCLIFSDMITGQHLPQFHRPGGWTVEEMSARRCAQAEEQYQGKRIVFTMHLLENIGSGDEVSTIVGSTGLRLEDDTGEFGIILHHPFWKRGLCSEATYLCLKYAFASLSIKRVDWFTAKDNVQMRGWCESLGMKAYEKPGLEMDDWVGYSLSASDWHNTVYHLLEQRLS